MVDSRRPDFHVEGVRRPVYPAAAVLLSLRFRSGGRQ